MLEMPNMRDNSIDLIFADLPYGTTDCAWDNKLPMKELWTQFKRLLKPNGAILLFAQQPFATELINAAGRMFRYQIIWEKTKSTGFLNAKRMPLRAHEMILVFYNRLPTYNPQMTPGKPYISKDKRRNKSSIYKFNHKPTTIINHGYRYPRDVVRFDISAEDGRHHPTQKPLALCRWGILTYSNPGDVVFDPTCGSGSIPVAAKQTDRRFIGFDTDAGHVATANLRLNTL